MVFDVALAVPIRNNTFEINWYVHVALLPNSVGSTAKTSLPWHTILWMHSICSFLRALWTKLSREAFTAVLVDRSEIHQSQPDSTTKKRLQGHTSGCNWWISIRSVNNTHNLPAAKKSIRRRSRQITAVKSLLMYRDVLTVLPTGYGKSLIFQAYVMARD